VIYRDWFAGPTCILHRNSPLLSVTLHDTKLRTWKYERNTGLFHLVIFGVHATFGRTAGFLPSANIPSLVHLSKRAALYLAACPWDCCLGVAHEIHSLTRAIHHKSAATSAILGASRMIFGTHFHQRSRSPRWSALSDDGRQHERKYCTRSSSAFLLEDLCLVITASRSDNADSILRRDRRVKNLQLQQQDLAPSDVLPRLLKDLCFS
jgi:hypothetical protein